MQKKIDATVLCEKEGRNKIQWEKISTYLNYMKIKTDVTL